MDGYMCIVIKKSFSRKMPSSTFI